MRKILTYIFLTTAINSFGQDYQFPALKTESISAKDFSPKGWFVADSIYGDLNRDELVDKVFILKKRDSVVITDINNDEYKIQPRVLVVVFKNDNAKYLLSEINKKLLIDYNFPPTYSPPFSSMTIKNNILTLNFSFDYINGNFYFYPYKFRFQKNQFRLIGAEQEYVTRRTMDFHKASYNFLTKKWSWTIGTHSNDDPPKLIKTTEWFKLTTDKLMTLKTIGRPGTWQVTKDKWL
jgi:hypothetical protein